MPFRCAVSPLAAPAVHPRLYLLYAPFLITPESSPRQKHQPFHSTACLRDKQIDNSQNHYETLKVQPGATPAEIKKSFYALSKTHHPDHNPTNPHAARRFMRISEAYSILSIPAKRLAYDRDTLRLHHGPHHSHHGHRGGGSYSSTSNPAGGRPASGLSRRRSTFQGPPPSFFRSGGWGAQGPKRRAAHDESTGFSSASSSSTGSSSGGGSSSTNTAGGMGPGQSPFGPGGAEEVPHFDRASHERTGRQIDRRRAARQATVDGHAVGIEPERGTAGMFFVIGGVLVLSVMAPVVVGKLWRGNGSGDDKKSENKGKKSRAAS
ncbi:DnaJ-domain-containing protein [Hypomontagnella submonticulosa]|nr:DnaJ-domain-containing protein [Hypomontagnella submonticulosa]